MSFEDPKGMFMCQLFPRRGSQKLDKGIDEWLWAETAAYVQFEKDFKARHKGGTVVGQLTYQTISTPTNPTLQFILDAMKVYFKNWWSQKNASREGGFRKPDGLGISADGRIIEIIEVKPYYNSKDGASQLKGMIDILKDGLRRYYYEKSVQGGISAGPDPDNFITIKGSPWKPGKGDLEVPLIGNPTNDIAWICYKPTLREENRADGVILYEIHSIEKKKVEQRIPDEVAKRLAEAFARQKKANSWNPFAQEAARANADAALINALILAVGVTAAVALIAAAVIYGSRLLGPALPLAVQAPLIVEETTQLVGGSYRIAATATTTYRIGTQVYYRIATDPEVREFAERTVENVRRMQMRR
jgi:hypothetical protein